MAERSQLYDDYAAIRDYDRRTPAPVEKMPVVVKVNPKACVKCGCGTSAHWADNDGPFQGAYCHSCCQCADYTPPATVESKPKDEDADDGIELDKDGECFGGTL
jgi:hypothetical protein